MDSVPLIGADDVWELDRNGRPCEPTGPSHIMTGNLVSEISREPTTEETPRECLTGKGVTIGIIDTGVDYTHEDLGGCFGPECKVIDGFDFVNGDNDPMDDHGHGTHVAATAAGNGVLKGVAPDADVISYKVLDQYGGGWGYDIIAAIDRSVDPNQDGDLSDHLDIISLSLGGWGNPDDDMSLAIDNAVELGVIVVIAAGNDYGEGTIGSPGTARKAITVGAVDKELNMADFSSKGPVIWEDALGNKVSLIKPDVVAPGVSICAAQWEDAWGDRECLDDEHTSISGTSMATPHVAGLAALIKQRNPSYNAEEIKTLIKNTAELLPNPEKVTTQGFGLLSALESVFFDDPMVVSLDPIELQNVEIDIAGKIIGDNFDHYELAYAPNVPLVELSESDWTLIITSELVPGDGILYDGFNLVTIPDGEYILRLEVFDTEGRVFEDYGYFEVDRFDMREPYNKDLANPNDDLIIRVNNKLNASIDDFEVEYSFNGGLWITDGVVITSVDSLEAKIVEDTINDSGSLDLKINVVSSDLITELLVQDIYLDSQLKKGWPIKIDPDYAPWGGELWAGLLEAVAGDVTGDMNKEIIIYSAGGPPKIRIYGFNGTLLNTIPLPESLYTSGLSHYPLLADLDSDGIDEIIVYNHNWDSPKLYSFNYDGSLVPNWPVFLPSPPLSPPPPNEAEFFPQIITADLDNDGSIEIVYKENYDNAFDVDQVPSKIIIISSNGSIVNQWNASIVTDVWHWWGSGYPAVGNFDDDSDLEIIAGYTINLDRRDPYEGINNWSAVRAFNIDGSEVWSLELQGAMYSSPAVGDINNDGKQEVIVTTAKNLPRGDLDGGYGLTAINNSGSVFWSTLQYPEGYNVRDNPVLADFNDDGFLEIVLYTRGGFANVNREYVFDYLGNILEGWPVLVPEGSTGENTYSSVVGDIDGDGSPDVVDAINNKLIGGFGSLHAWHYDGLEVQGFPKEIDHWVVASPIISDLEPDGNVNIIASAGMDIVSVSYPSVEILTRGLVYVWDVENNFNEENQEWPTFQHDNQRTGCYDCFEWQLLWDNYQGEEGYDHESMLSSERETFVTWSWTADDAVFDECVDVQKIKWIGMRQPHQDVEYNTADVIILDSDFNTVSEFSDVDYTAEIIGTDFDMETYEGTLSVPDITLEPGHYYFGVRLVGNYRGRNHAATTGDGGIQGQTQGITQSGFFGYPEWTFVEEVMESETPTDFSYRIYGTPC
ncbi:S8 family serine peptidase [Patescibacteria group bacterium]|nr:S8 family serine peptidase [Patescibacteria group bacterium]